MTHKIQGSCTRVFTLLFIGDFMVELVWRLSGVSMEKA